MRCNPAYPADLIASCSTRGFRSWHYSCLSAVTGIEGLNHLFS